MNLQIKSGLFSQIAFLRVTSLCGEIRTILLLAFEGEKSRDSRALDRGGEKSLMSRASAAHSAGKDFAAFGNVFLQTVDILVIDFVDLFLAESALFLTAVFSSMMKTPYLE